MTGKPQVLVTGSTGRLGSLVAVASRDDYGLRPRILVRDHNLGTDWQPPRGMDVAVGDYTDSGSLRTALEDVAAVFLISPVHPDMVTRECALVDVAAELRTHPRIVKVSGLATELDSPVDSGRWHARIEEAIKNTDLPAVFLRPSFFMQNLGFQADSVRTRGLLRGAVGDASIAMVDARDIADVAAAILSGRASPDSQAVDLTTSRGWSYDQIAAALSHAFQRRVDYQRQTADEVRSALVAAGQPDWHIRILLQFNSAFIAGQGSRLSNSVRQVLGREPRTLEDYLQELAGGAATTGADPFPS